MKKKKILLYSNQFPEIGVQFSKSFLKNFEVYTTSSMLQAVHYLKIEDVGMALAVGDFSSDENDSFKSIVEMIRPGINVVFFKPDAEGGNELTLGSEDFSSFLDTALETETSLNNRLSQFKDFFMSFADRMLHIFGATNLYFFNKDHMVARLSKLTAVRLGLDEEASDNIQIAALLRDIGMLSIQQQLLQEKHKFSSNELTSIKKHPNNTVQILKQVKFPWNVDSVILQHHENYDGSGYPMKLKGRDICIGARIVHLADSYVAMTTERPYRIALSHEEARLEIGRHIGKDFDSEVAEKFLEVLDEEIKHDESVLSLLVFEAEPNISRIIKLGADTDTDTFNVVQATTTTELLENIKREVPNLTLVDVGMLNNETLISFFNTMYEIPLFETCPFIFVMTDPLFEKHFVGDNVRYLDMPIDMDELVHMVKELLVEAAPRPDEGEEVAFLTSQFLDTRYEGGTLVGSAGEKEEEKGITGILDDFNLSEIVQILQMGLKTARIEIKFNGSIGTVHMQSGNIVQAATNKLDGEEAFYEMMRWPYGDFRIHHGIRSEDNNITSETTYLLLESAKIMDDMNRTKH